MPSIVYYLIIIVISLFIFFIINLIKNIISLRKEEIYYDVKSSIFQISEDYYQDTVITYESKRSSKLSLPIVTISDETNKHIERYQRQKTYSF